MYKQEGFLGSIWDVFCLHLPYLRWKWRGFIKPSYAFFTWVVWHCCFIARRSWILSRAWCDLYDVCMFSCVNVSCFQELWFPSTVQTMTHDPDWVSAKRVWLRLVCKHWWFGCLLTYTAVDKGRNKSVSGFVNILYIKEKHRWRQTDG